MKDITKEPFSEGTITKLDIFEEYTREWLPVFIHKAYYESIHIHDYFAGMGTDINGKPGSPLRVLKVISEYKEHIIKNNKKIYLIFNEIDERKYKALKNIVESKKEISLVNEGLLKIQYENEDFKDIFYKTKNTVADKPCLMFLDQNGIKQITEEVFHALEELKYVDFMFYISSSYFKRFGEEDSFKEHFPDISITEFRKIKHCDSHRFVHKYYQDKLPSGSKTRIYPFTIKKGPNINGLIFGSKHPLGVDKFLHIAWNTNKLNGEANFDIDDDVDKRQGELFNEYKKKTKIDLFNEELINFVLSKQSVTNKEIYNYTLEKGHIGKHASKIICSLREEGKIKYNGHAKINYDSCYNNSDIIKYKSI